MTNALVPVKPGVGLKVGEIVQIAEMMAVSGLFPDLASKAQAVVKVQAGQELGIPPFAAMSAFQIIAGKVSLAPQGMLALIGSQEGCSYEIKEVSDKKAAILFKREGRADYLCTYTQAEAKEAGLLDGKNKHTWKSYMADMLFWRCVSRGFRRYYPDLVMGTKIYIPEELDVVVNQQGEPVAQEIEAEVITPQSEPVGQSEADELEALIQEVGADRNKWLVYLKVEDFTALTREQYDTMKSTLNRKKEAKHG